MASKFNIVVDEEKASGERAFDPSNLAPRRIYVDTFGCQMNEHDSERIIGLMAGEGYAPTDDPAEADLIVLNSCSVREKAEQKLRSAAGALGRWKRRRKDVIVAIGGCVAQQEGDRLLERIDHADIVFGPDHLSSFPEMVRKVRRDRVRIGETAFVHRDDYRFPGIADASPRRVSAYVSVMKGCDKFCSFCIVPFTRGREVSRPASEILDEVRTHASRGAREIVLLGQTVNGYGKRGFEGQIPFHELILRVADVSGIERIRFTSPHPSEFSEEQIAAFRDVEKLCPHMHLPLQSGSSAVLAAMRRDYDREEFLRIVERLREVAPKVALTTDLIVGFPGETDADFEDTLSMLRTIRFQAAFSYAYSERDGTKAIELGNSVPQAERMRRLHVLQELQESITREWLASMVGRTYSVLIEGPSKTDDTRSTGRTGENRPVHVTGRFEPGTILDVVIDEAFKHSLLGRPVGASR